MKTVMMSMILLCLVFYNCNENSKKNSNPLKKHIIYNKDFNKFNSMKIFDSLFSTLDCDDETLIDKAIQNLNDSISQIKDQILIRLDSSSQNKELKKYSQAFKQLILENENTDSLFFDYTQSLLFHSYGNATAKGFDSKCFKAQMLKQHLFFLKAIFENSYWNYDFDK